MRWLDNITKPNADDSEGTREMVEDRAAWRAAVRGRQRSDVISD